MIRKIFTLFTATLVIATTLSFNMTLAVGVDQKQLADPAQEAQARDLFKKYRCLVCQNQSIEDSDAELAADLRAIIREQVAAGKSPEQIQIFLVERYGDWVLLTPKFSGFTLLLWLFPLLVLVLGLVIAFVLISKQKPAPRLEIDEISSEDKKAIEQFRQN